MTTRVGLDATCYPNPDDDTCRVGCNIRNDARVTLAQMMTRVGLGTTCYLSPDDDTWRVGCEPRVQSITVWREKKPSYKGKLNRICRGTFFITAHCFGFSAL